MISTLALLGFLALVFLLAHRIVVACERHRQPWQHEFAGGKIRQKQPGIPPEGSEPLVHLRQV